MTDHGALAAPETPTDPTAAPGREIGALESHLRARRDAGHKLLVPYISGGVTADWTDIVRAFAAAGADAIEIGIPFSDPVMDGPTIQESSARALERGTTPRSILNDLRRVEVDVPLVIMTYANLVFRTGARRFAAEAVEAGVRGIILPDVPLEELDEWEPAADGAGLETVLLASPITPDVRLARLAQRARGFLYGVNFLGITGERESLGDRSAQLARRLKAVSSMPVLMGFGVSTASQAVEVAAPADGVVVGSALMRVVLDGGGPDGAGELLGAMRAALDA